MGGVLEAFWFEIRVTRGMMGRRGSDCCLWSGFFRYELFEIIRKRKRISCTKSMDFEKF